MCLSRLSHHFHTAVEDLSTIPQYANCAFISSMASNKMKYLFLVNILDGDVFAIFVGLASFSSRRRRVKRGSNFSGALFRFRTALSRTGAGKLLPFNFSQWL